MVLSKNSFMYKGIILAGGQGTRLYPSSLVVSKQLMNVYDKPLIYYPISTLMISGIREILIIATPYYVEQYMELLGDGAQWNVKFTYAVQKQFGGIAEAFLIAEDFIGNDDVCLILGDNIIYGNGMNNILTRCRENKGATVLSYHVQDPHRFGIVEFDKNKKVISIEEKPENPKSNYAVIGLYFYDNKVVEYAKQIEPSPRGELEITDINKRYLQEGKLNVENLSRGIAWIDAGTFDSLLTASNFISTVEKMQGTKISCPEEIAYRNGWITLEELKELADPLVKSGYGKYLYSIYQEKL
jgi:glucose-1-phosphate thymidylyltransferase